VRRAGALALAVWGAALAGCGPADGPGGATSATTTTTPATTPPLAALGAVPVPEAEPLTDAKVELGRRLFFDARFSADVTLSCAGCHDPRLGWGDGTALSRAYAGTQHWRNAPTVVNAAYLSALFWTARAPTLQKQADGAITGAIEGNGDRDMIAERLAEVPVYVEGFKAAFGAERPSYALALDAIAAFERSVAISTDSPFDRHLRGEAGALSEPATRGLKLFQGKANCVACHNGALLTDQQVHITGVPESPLLANDPQRRITVRMQHAASGVPALVSKERPGDLGRYHDTGQAEHLGAFRTAPLRYLAFTAPYMHNGVFATLEEVIDFYDRGGGDIGGKDARLKPLGLTAAEKSDLVAFLEACSGKRIVIAAPDPAPYAEQR
jgi:cytochrome c peroxidase